MTIQKEPKNLHAVTMLHSWLDSVFIDNEINEDFTITVQDSNRNPVEVRVDFEGDISDRIFINAKDLTGKNIQKAKDIFRNLVETLGYEFIDPIDRGVLPDRRINSKDDFEGLYLRHKDIMRTPNIDKKRLDKYKTVIQTVSGKIYRQAPTLFKDFSMDIEDLISISNMHTMVFISQYELPAEMDKDNNNLKKCYNFLLQRLVYLKYLLKNKNKNITQNARMSVFTNFSGYNTITDLASSTEEEPDEDYIKRHNQFTSINKNKRKQQAKELLKTELDKLSHDDKIYVLSLAAENTYIDIEAKKLANSMLESHKKECLTCLSTHKSEQSSLVHLNS